MQRSAKRTPAPNPASVLSGPDDEGNRPNPFWEGAAGLFESASHWFQHLERCNGLGAGAGEHSTARGTTVHTMRKQCR